MSESEGSFGWESDESLNGNIDIKEEKLTPVKNDKHVEKHDDNSEFLVKRKSIKNMLTDSEDSDDYKKITKFNKKVSNDSNKSSLKKSIPNIKMEVDSDINNEDDEDEDDEEVWGLQCPKNLDISSLESIDFFNNTNKFKIDGKMYEFELKKYEDKRKINIIFPDLPDNEKIKTYDFNGFIHMHDKIKPPNLIELLPEKKSIVKFPTDLVTRHPLLGFRYKTILKLPTDISEKLSDVNNCVKLKSKIKTEVEIEETETPVPRKKKRKHEESLSENIISPKKIKIENSDNWLSEQSIEQSLFSNTSKTVKIKKEKNF